MAWLGVAGIDWLWQLLVIYGCYGYIPEASRFYGLYLVFIEIQSLQVVKAGKHQMSNHLKIVFIEMDISYRGNTNEGIISDIIYRILM